MELWEKTKFPTVNLNDAILIPAGDFPKNIRFRIDSSNDPDGSIVNYEWNFGDLGSTGNIINNSTDNDVIHTFNAPGTYTITITVTDNNGAMGSDSTTITLEEPPAPDFSFIAFPEPQPLEGYPIGSTVEIQFTIIPSDMPASSNYSMVMDFGRGIFEYGGMTYSRGQQIPITSLSSIGYFTSLSTDIQENLTFKVRIIGYLKIHNLCFNIAIPLLV